MIDALSCVLGIVAGLAVGLGVCCLVLLGHIHRLESEGEIDL